MIVCSVPLFGKTWQSRGRTAVGALKPGVLSLNLSFVLRGRVTLDKFFHLFEFQFPLWYFGDTAHSPSRLVCR